MHKCIGTKSSSALLCSASLNDSYINSVDEFRERVREHSFLELMCCWLPKCFIWKEELNILAWLGRGIDMAKLRKQVIEVLERDTEVAQKYISKGNIQRGLKTLLHTIRQLVLSIQIAKYGRIIDYTAAYPIAIEMNEYAVAQPSNEASTWEYFRRKYESLINELRLDLAGRINP